MRVPRGEPAPPGQGGKGLQRFMESARPYARDIALGTALLPVVTALRLVQPYLLKVALDGDRETMLNMALLLAGTVLLGYAAESFHMYALQRAGHRTITGMRSRLYRHVLSQGTSFFDRRPVGALLSRVSSDTESVGQSFTLGLISMVGDVLLVLGTVGAMLWLDARVTAYLLLLAPPIVIVVRLFQRLLRGYADEIRRAVARMNSVIEENLAGIDIVHLFSRARQSRREGEEQSHHYFSLYTRFNVADAGLYAIMESLSALTVGAVLWFTAGPVLGGLMTLGLVVAFVEYAQRAFVPIRELSGKLAALQSAFASLDRMDNTLSFSEQAPHGAERWEERRGSLRFEDVTFRYREKGPDVLEHLDLEIRPGERVAVVGPTGSGKTTLLNLLTRHYKPTGGRILLDGHVVEQVGDEDFREGVGIIRQDVFLFEGTIYDNVALGDPTITRERAREALEAAGLWRLVEEREGGLDALVEERGRNLSAGEGQLLTLARIFARDPIVVLLDEATARVDSLTEALISEAIARLMQGRTVIAVAHRLSTVREADRILVMVRGRIAESGTHTELLDANGLYARMWRHRVR